MNQPIGIGFWQQVMAAKSYLELLDEWNEACGLLKPICGDPSQYVYACENGAFMSDDTGETEEAVTVNDAGQLVTSDGNPAEDKVEQERRRYKKWQKARPSSKDDWRYQ